MAKASSNHDIDPSKVALLVIDVQRALFSRPTPIHNAEQLLSNINSLIDMWELVGGLVVYIQHSNKKMLVKDTPDWELHPDIKIINSSRWIHKLHGNAFEQTELNDMLSSRGVDQVAIYDLVPNGRGKDMMDEIMLQEQRESLIRYLHRMQEEKEMIFVFSGGNPLYPEIASEMHRTNGTNPPNLLLKQFWIHAPVGCHAGINYFSFDLTAMFILALFCKLRSGILEIRALRTCGRVRSFSKHSETEVC